MAEGRTEFKPFGVECRARHCRLAFLVDPSKCPPELLDSLFETNYGLWGGRFNPIIPVQNGEVGEEFWSLLTFADPDLVYSYAELKQSTVDRIDRQIVPWRIEAHPSHLFESHPHPHYHPQVSDQLVKSRQVLPLLMSQRSGFVFPAESILLTYFHDWKMPLNKELVRLVSRNFGVIQERSFPALPDGWARLQVQNNWTPVDLFHGLAVTRNVLFPFQASAIRSITPQRFDTPLDEYSILIGDSADTWLYFWNRVFLVRDYLRNAWNTLCLPTSLLQDEKFVDTLREFLRRYVLRSGNHPSRLTLQSFECSDDELSKLQQKVLNGLDVISGFKKLGPGEFPHLTPSRAEVYRSWGSQTSHQQGTSRESLLSAPSSQVPIDKGHWAIDLRIQYFPQFAFYGNEVLSWKLPRRVGVAESFFSHSRCRIDAEYALSVEMQDLGSFILRIPDETEIFYRASGMTETNSYNANLAVIRKNPKFRRMGKWDKGLYLNGILELFGGLQSASRFFEHSFWRGIFERLSMGLPEKEAGLFERVRNSLEKKKPLMTSQLAGGHAKPIDWLSHLVIRQARELQLRQEEISFSELEVAFLEQREQFITANPSFRTGTTPAEIEADRKAATEDLLRVVQSLTDGGVLQQGIRVRCHNCGSRFWREIGTLQQKLTCDGCKASVPVPVESAWRYRLNSLVRNGIALHGCVAVISALRGLRERARESFIYTHGVALFKDYDDPKPAAEMDLLCISDGKLICGEVKSSASEFTEEELSKLARIAADIGADEAAISAFNDPSGLMSRHAEALTKLLPTGCTVAICGPAPWTFERQPHAF